MRAATSLDSAWARAGGRVLVCWPADSAPVAAHGVSTERTTLVALLGRSLVGAGATVARWEDGAPAVVERPRPRMRARSGRALAGGRRWATRRPIAHSTTLSAPCGYPRLEPDTAWMTATSGEVPPAIAGCGRVDVDTVAAGAGRHPAGGGAVRAAAEGRMTARERVERAAGALRSARRVAATATRCLDAHDAGVRCGDRREHRLTARAARFRMLPRRS